jgi:hypothetical protein
MDGYMAGVLLRVIGITVTCACATVSEVYITAVFINVRKNEKKKF